MRPILNVSGQKIVIVLWVNCTTTWRNLPPPSLYSTGEFLSIEAPPTQRLGKCSSRKESQMLVQPESSSSCVSLQHVRVDVGVSFSRQILQILSFPPIVRCSLSLQRSDREPEALAHPFSQVCLILCALAPRGR